MTRGEDFIEKGKCKNNYCSSMSNSAWCDLNSKRNILKLLDKCLYSNCNCQKILTFTPHQLMLEGRSIKNKLQESLRGTKKAWNSFIKPGLKMETPLISAAIAVKTKNPKVAQATTNISKSISGGKILSLTDLHGNGLSLKVR